jgi:hypothetical protein
MVVLADASKYNAFGSDGCNYMWRKLGEELGKNLYLAVKHGGNRIMVRDAWQLH